MDYPPLSDPAHLLYRFTDAVDRRDADEAARCFTPDAVFRPGSKSVGGAGEIKEFYRSRFADPRRKTRHLWSNVRGFGQGGGSMRVTAILTNYAYEPAVSEATLQMRIGNVDCLLQQHSGGPWLFAEHLYESAYSVSLPFSS